MNMRLILAAGVAVSLLSVAACNRETDSETDAMAADDSAMDASTVEDETDTGAGTGAGASAAGSNTASGSTGDTVPVTASDPETASAGPAAMAAPGSTQEQIDMTRETLSPAGASSGPTAPRPQ